MKHQAQKNQLKFDLLPYLKIRFGPLLRQSLTKVELVRETQGRARHVTYSLEVGWRTDDGLEQTRRTGAMHNASSVFAEAIINHNNMGLYCWMDICSEILADETVTEFQKATKYIMEDARYFDEIEKKEDMLYQKQAQTT